VYPRVGFIVTNMSCPAERVVAFYNKRLPSSVGVDGPDGIDCARMRSQHQTKETVRGTA
jgi:hypothetical protein